jgi:hypothetical protein
VLILGLHYIVQRNTCNHEWQEKEGRLTELVYHLSSYYVIIGCRRIRIWFRLLTPWWYDDGTNFKLQTYNVGATTLKKGLKNVGVCLGENNPSLWKMPLFIYFSICKIVVKSRLDANDNNNQEVPNHIMQLFQQQTKPLVSRSFEGWRGKRKSPFFKCQKGGGTRAGKRLKCSPWTWS